MTDTETLYATDGRWVLRIERKLAHPVEKVWRAITDPAELSAWFPADMDMDLQPGGKILFVFRHGEGPTQDGTIVELDPPRVFAYSWGDTVLRWELRPDGDGCLLTFTHTFDDRPAAASFAAGWTLRLEGLAAALAGQPVAETDPDRWAELHESFVERFGLAEGTVESTPEGWVIHFDRQMVRPVDAVWAALSREVTAVEPPTLLEYQWLADGREAGRVRFTLSEGNGGARLRLTQTGPLELAEVRPRALAAWHTYLELLADRLRGRTRPWPSGQMPPPAMPFGRSPSASSGRTEDLVAYYTAKLR